MNHMKLNFQSPGMGTWAKRALSCLTLLALICASGCACARGVIKSEDDTKDVEDDYASEIISPEDEDTVQAYTKTVSLYFPYADDTTLGREEREIVYSANERFEKAVIEELIAGPSEDYPDLTRIVNENTEVVSVSTNGTCLFVTFNAYFLEPIDELDEGWESDQTLYAQVTAQRKSAIYAIVDTVTGLTGITQVQILVDTEGDGLGRRIKRQDAGLALTSDNPDELLEMLSRQYAVIASPQNTTALVFKCLQDKDYERLYHYIAKIGSQDRPTYSEWIDAFEGEEWTLESFEVHDVTVGYDGLSAEAYVSASFDTSTSGTVEYTNKKIMLICESGVWKIDYASMLTLIPSQN